MIYGIGVDVVMIARVRRSLDRFGERFAQRVLTASELEEYRASRHPERLLAKRFAAKEAVFKALGLGFREGLTLNGIGVIHDASGKPEVVYQGSTRELVQRLGVTRSLISISDEQEYAVAFVVLLRE